MRELLLAAIMSPPYQLKEMPSILIKHPLPDGTGLPKPTNHKFPLDSMMKTSTSNDDDAMKNELGVAKGTGTKFDKGKLRYDLIPPGPLREIAKVLTDGANVHGDYNWSEVPEAKARYTAALMRHLEDWRAGDTFDKETGQNHLAHLATNAIFLLYLDQKNESKSSEPK